MIANKNAPEQCVLSGPRTEIDRAGQLLAEQGVTARRLAVSAAFHSRFVARARDALRDELSTVEIQPARLPVFANATGELYPDGRGPGT